MKATGSSAAQVTYKRHTLEPDAAPSDALRRHDDRADAIPAQR
jgi:hypothetical protein